MNEKLLTAKDVHEILRIPVEGVYRLGRDGKLNVIKVGKYVRFSPTDVQNFIAANGGAK